MRATCKVFLLTLCAALGAQAATRSWIGGGADGNWSSAANWGGTAPVENDALAFGGSVRLANSNDLAADTRLNGIIFLAGAGAFNLSGNRVALAGDITNSSTTAQVSGLPLALQQDTAFVITEVTGLLTVTGAVSGAYGVTKKGPGQFKLYPKATCTYTGDTAVYGGQLLVGWTYFTGIANPLSTSSHLVLSSGILTFIASGSTESQAFNGTALKTGANIIHINKNNAGTLTASLGALTRDSGATLNIARTGSNSGTKNLSSSSWTSGLTILDSGVAYATTYTSTTSGAIPSATGDDWAAFNGTTTVAATYTTNTATTLTGNASVTNMDTTLSSDTAVTTLRFAQPAARIVTVATDKTLTTGGILVSSTVGNKLSSITNGTLRSAATVADRDLVIINNDTSSSLAIGSVIANAAAGATGLTKSGPGALTLTATNTYTGPTVINAGKITVSSVASKSIAQPLGMGDIVLGGGTLIFAVGGNLFQGTDKTMTLLEGTTSTVEVNATAAGEKGFAGTGRITGAGNLVINAATGSADDSRLTMGGSNDFTGTLTINSGHLQVSNTSIGSNANIVVNSGGCLRMATLAPWERRWGLGALSGAGNLEGGYSAGSTNVFAVGGLNTDSTFSGAIVNYNLGKAAFAKVGTGTLTLSGANTYSGQTTVETGTLKLGANGTLSSGSAVSVFADAVLDVGATTNAPPSISGAGTLRMSGTGKLNVSGALNVADITLEVTDLALLAKETRVIATGSPVTGPFQVTNVTAPWTVRYTGTEVRLVYDGGTLIQIF